jgi:hypothetical protein
MKKRIFFTTLLLVVSFLSLFFWRTTVLQKRDDAAAFQISLQKERNIKNEQAFLDAQKIEKQNVPVINSDSSSIESEKNETVEIKKKDDVKVPFTVQAPLGHWSDMRFQDGCEEASVAMAFKWTQNKTFTSSTDAEEEILKIVKFEEKTFGHYIDSSADVGKILSQFYGYENHRVVENFTSDDMKKELSTGNILLVPAYGRALKNPNFKAPGPVAHMLVVVGWDSKTGEFITNDPGTRRGEGYRYDEKLLFDAIWAYPSSEEHPTVPKSTQNKAMLVVSKN